MSTRIRNIPPPIRHNDRRNNGDSDDDTVSSWDSTYQRQPVEQNVAQQHQQICSHAVSIGHHVFGINNSNNNDNAADETFNDGIIDNNWWTWQRSLAEKTHRVELVSSTHCVRMQVEQSLQWHQIRG